MAKIIVVQNSILKMMWINNKFKDITVHLGLKLATQMVFIRKTLWKELYLVLVHSDRLLEFLY